MDGRLFEQHRNENSNKRSEVRMGQWEKWSSSRILVYVSDMTEGANSYMSVFADDAKLLRKIKSKEDCEHSQKDLDKFHR